MAEGFLGRWSRRKLGVEDGEPAMPAPPPVVPAQAQVPAEAEQAPPPTLDDVAALTPESDFSRFVRSEVDPQVRNAAARKLFADPHFQIMDGMDVYIDDYSQPDPIPERMLRTLASAEFLGLFREQETPDPDAPVARVDADDAAGQSVPQSEPTEPGSTHQDADPDLRLQQDHAPGPPGPGPGAG